MTPRTERRRAEREAQSLEERVERLVALKRPIPDGLAMALKAARFRALQIGPVRRPKERPLVSEASA